MLFDRFVAFSAQIEKIYKDIQKIKTDKMNSLGLKGTDASVLIQASKYPDGLTVTELAAECEVDKAVVSRASRVLINQGYMTASLEVRRYRKTLKLTEKGMAAAKEIAEIAVAAVDAVSQDIPEGEIDNFHKTLEQIAENIRQLTGKKRRETT